MKNIEISDEPIKEGDFIINIDNINTFKAPDNLDLVFRCKKISSENIIYEKGDKEYDGLVKNYKKVNHIVVNSFKPLSSRDSHQYYAKKCFTNKEDSI